MPTVKSESMGEPEPPVEPMPAVESEPMGEPEPPVEPMPELTAEPKPPAEPKRRWPLRKQMLAAIIERLYGPEGPGDIGTAAILKQVADGNRNRDIAEKLFISEETVKVHVKHIMEKLGASDRTQAVAIGVRRGIIQL